ncbi:hypothetical protein VKT23_000750 [Stygiomarasmius scandens]|uniref:Uncharacterized protein n=1 Tax=Marasmiellus scandens TaxID=2682957 RepID=A0ABR1K8V8_9AGAR
MSISVQRFKQVYVEIPPSPLHTPPPVTDNTHVGPSSFLARTASHNNLKENTPFRHRHDSISQGNPHVSHTVPRKRKLSDMSTHPSSSSKKPKSEAPESQESSDLVYCHQCGKKREASSKSLFPLHFWLF